MASEVSGSFVTAVLATAGRLDKDDLNTKLGQLSRKIDEVKLQVHDALLKKYAEFYPLFDTTCQLKTRVSDLQREMESTLSTMEKQIKAQMRVTTNDYDSLQLRCNETKLVLNILNQLVKLNETFQSVDQYITQKCYVEATRSHRVARSILNELNAAYSDHLKVLPCLVRKHAMQGEKLESRAVQCWNELVSWRTNEDSCIGSTSNQLLKLVVTKSSSSDEEIASLVQSLHNLGLLDDIINKFGDKVMQNLVLPCLQKSGSQVVADDTASSTSLHIKVASEKETDRCKVATCGLYSVSMIFQVLYDNLLKTTVTDEAKAGTSNDQLPNTQTLMSILSRFHCSSLLDAVMRDCLSAAIPSSRSELQGYESVIVLTEGMHEKLLACGFIPADDKTISNYVSSIETLFANKRCQEVLEKARSLMKSEIHNIVQVSDDDPVAKPAASLNLPSLDAGGGSSKKSKASATNTDVKLDPLFSFPTCHISIATQKLVQLAYSTMNEAIFNGDEKSSSSAIQLFYCVRNIFEMFVTVVPVYHKERLRTVPQMAAVHHNDCMYIAHHLTFMAHQFRPRLPEPLCSGAGTFIDLVPVLRRSGTQCFLEQMSAQKNQLIQCLKLAHGFVALSEGENFDTAENVICQIQHQLHHLVNVWQGILPSHVYAKALGTLVNSIVVELVSCILSLDDISEQDASMLSMLLTTFCDSAQSDILSVITEQCPMPLMKLVPSWARLEEIRFVLKARLQEIVDRWTDGPLANEMTTTEVKQLIRALFTNTDRRSAALAAIK